MIDWPTVFEEIDPQPPATSRDIDALREDLTRPLSEQEIAKTVSDQYNPWPKSYPLHSEWKPLDATGWRLPNAPLPPSYLEFLQWSNGPWCRNGQREFAFLSSSDVRDYLLKYHFPYYMPDAIPLGLDGGGIFAVLDTRGDPAPEYPILAAAAGVLDYSACVTLANSFHGFCTATTRIAEPR